MIYRLSDRSPDTMRLGRDETDGDRKEQGGSMQVLHKGPPRASSRGLFCKE